MRIHFAITGKLVAAALCFATFVQAAAFPLQTRDIQPVLDKIHDIGDALASYTSSALQWDGTDAGILTLMETYDHVRHAAVLFQAVIGTITHQDDAAVIQALHPVFTTRWADHAEATYQLALKSKNSPVHGKVRSEWFRCFLAVDAAWNALMDYDTNDYQAEYINYWTTYDKYDGPIFNA